jgi:putative peptide maturation dehydrogenase
MTHIRRTPYAFFYLEDGYLLDLASLVRGEVPAAGSEARVLALAILCGERHQLGREELDLLLSVPAERWISEDGRDRELVRALANKGLLVSDADDGRLSTLRKRDEALSAAAWNPYAALYHYMTQWSAVGTGEGEDDDDEQQAERILGASGAFVAQHGPPPDTFAKARVGWTLTLPGLERDGPFYRTLSARRTTRRFDQDTPMTLEQLDALLLYVFGCHGYASGALDLVCIKRTSPSGGGLHPIEAYPIVTNVVGVSSGIYQYSVRAHALTLLAELEPCEARRVATAFMCGQSWFGAAHVSFILTARFYRNQWKYRRHHRAYAAILMDAAHLTQTLYLVGGELGLGAFVTIAINASDIERYLSLDGVTEGVIAMAGCGLGAPGASPLDLKFSPGLPP